MSLSPLIRFGTSIWTYEGWQGQVYKRQYVKSRFALESLGEYCQYGDGNKPLFRTVGNDATFYRPPTANQLRRYLTQIPENFDMCFKVWEEITIPSFANQPRYGAKAGQPNPSFLNAGLFNEFVITPYREAGFEPHTGPFLFEFQRHGMASSEFCSRLDVFFCQLTMDFRYAVEIRNAGLLGADYRAVPEKHGVAHVYNHWSYMPPLAEQHQRMERFTAPFTVIRLLTPLKMAYGVAKQRAQPYNKIVRCCRRCDTIRWRWSNRWWRESTSLRAGKQSIGRKCANDDRNSHNGLSAPIAVPAEAIRNLRSGCPPLRYRNGADKRRSRSSARRTRP